MLFFFILLIYDKEEVIVVLKRKKKEFTNIKIYTSKKKIKVKIGKKKTK